MADPVVVVIDHAAISALTAPGKPVFRFTQRLTRETEEVARAHCPIGGAYWGPGRRAGHLRSSHKRSVRKTGVNTCEGVVVNTAHYAKFVHEGTGFIHAKEGKYLTMRIGGKWHRVKTARGQNANPWMANALDHVMALHR